MTRNLIISPIGQRSMHRTWISGPVKQNFDLMLIDYSDGPALACADARYYVRRKGFKFELLDFVLQQHADVVAQYDRIWCPDDDIACDTAGVNLLFDIFQRFRLQLAQPAIAKGQSSYKCLIQRRGNILRFSPYVEIMCPLFAREALLKVKDLFLENRSGWGLDWLWSRRFKPREMAIIDRVGVHHTGNLGRGEHYRNLTKLGIDPFRDFRQTMARHGGLDWILHNRMLRGRLVMKSVRDPHDRRTLVQRAVDLFRWRRLRRSTVAA